MSMLSLYTELRPFIKKFPIGKLLSVFVSNIIKTLTFLNLLRNVNLFNFFSRITFLVCHCITDEVWHYLSELVWSFLSGPGLPLVIYFIYLEKMEIDLFFDLFECFLIWFIYLPSSCIFCLPVSFDQLHLKFSVLKIELLSNIMFCLQSLVYSLGFG